MSRVGVPSSLGFLLRPLGFALLRGLSVVGISSTLEFLIGGGVEDCDKPTGGLGPDNFKVIFKGEVMCFFRDLKMKYFVSRDIKQEAGLQPIQWPM